MIRKLTIVALAIVGLQICEILTLGTSPSGSLFTNCLQILASGIAAAMCFAACRRGHGLSRPFWLLVGCGLAMWGVANLSWMYYENWLHREPPSTSIVRFFFQAEGIFLAVALFQDEDKDSPKLNLASFLDLAQIGIVFFFVYFGLYFVPILRGNSQNALAREALTEMGENAALVVLAVIRMKWARTPRLRRLYGELTVFLLVYLVGSGIAEWAQSLHEVPTGTWYDLGWTVPLLAGALWAGGWVEKEEPAQVRKPRSKSLAKSVAANVVVALAPLFGVILAANVGTQWRMIAFSLLGASILVYAVRLGLSEYEEARNANLLRRQTQAIESAADGMAILNTSGEYVYLNSAHTQMFGYQSPADLLGKTWRVLYDPQETERFEKKIFPEYEEHGRWSGEALARRRDGTYFPQELSLTKLEGGGMVCVCRDVTARCDAQNERDTAEAKYRLLVEQVAAISYIAEIGITGQWHYVSPQIGTILGYTPEEWISSSRDWIRFVHPEDQAVVAAAEAACEKGKPFQAEYRMLRKDGRTIWVSDNAVVVEDPRGQRLMEGIIADISDRKTLEGQLQQSRRVEAVGRLAGGIAHDFNNLLTIVKGYTELALKRSAQQPELTADLQRIEDASERAASLVRQLLAFSRKQVLQPKIFDLNNVVLALDKLLRRLMGEDIEMRTIVSPDAGNVKADPGQIEQVIMNLVVNARDAMPSGGRLTVETASVELDEAYARDHASVVPGQYVMLAVSDTGMGMSAETIAHIFEPFYSTKTSGGTGLGLSTVYGIVKQSGGYIWVYSELGHGSTFKVYLPRVEEAVEALTADKKEKKIGSGTETILLVEDDEAVRELARTVLSSRGYNVLVAAKPTDAERVCDENAEEIKLLLTDVVMPGLSGREIARRIGARFPKIRVLYMSGYTDNVIAHGGVLEEGLAFLQKPFTPSTLVEKVREILDKPVLVK
jgi:PAS domain S-box-containing protein